MRHIPAIITTALMLMSSISASGWGQKGHDVIASIAEQNLTKKARKAIDGLLDGRSIVFYSSWMDNIQNSPYWEYGYNKTKTWHYANVDKGMTYETMQKNENGDVITALNFLTKELTANEAALTDSMKVDYLKMIIHLVGDLHCPMHAGRLSDTGGNRVRVKWFGHNTNLHSVWDSKMIESARKWGYQEWTEQLDRADRKTRKALVQGNYEEWFSETVEAAAEIYDYVERLEDKEPNLSYQFVYDFSPLLEERLLAGGYRLAHVLNMIFG